MQYSKLYSKSNYRNNSPYLINTLIYEYDLSKANISALLFLGIISKNEYDYYLSLDKQSRQIQIGYKYLKNNDNNKKLKEAISYAREKLFEYNNIQDSEVLSIKNDAVFITRRLVNTSFDMFNFKLKNTYSSYLYLVDLELYYSAKFLSDGTLNFNIDVKGIKDTMIPLHENGFMQILGLTFYQIERGSTYDLIPYLMDTYEKFIKRELPLEYYRNFDNYSKYTVFTNKFSYSYDAVVKQEDLKYISIDRNLLLLRNLIKTISSINKF